jgi:hypothetical protein
MDVRSEGDTEPFISLRISLMIFKHYLYLVYVIVIASNNRTKKLARQAGSHWPLNIITLEGSSKLHFNNSTS